jgi:hypothetical protein
MLIHLGVGDFCAVAIDREDMQRYIIIKLRRVDGVAARTARFLLGSTSHFQIDRTEYYESIQTLKSIQQPLNNPGAAEKLRKHDAFRNRRRQKARQTPDDVPYLLLDRNPNQSLRFAYDTNELQEQLLFVVTYLRFDQEQVTLSVDCTSGIRVLSAEAFKAEVSSKTYSQYIKQR